MIDVEQISKRFGAVRAVTDATFRVERGEAVGLLGPNGAGKTTTIRMITGFLPPDRGFVKIDGADTLDDSLAARSKIGYLPESTPLYADMTVAGLLSYRARLFRLPRRERRSAVDRAIDRCWLGEMRSRRIGQLSKGYRQRVGLAAAILHDPPALLLDEPTNGLDPSQIAEMRSLMCELAQDRAVIVSSHILSEIEKTCDRIIVIARGAIRANATIREFEQTAGGRCIVEAHIAEQSDDDAFEAALVAIPGVADVAHEQRQSWKRFILTPGNDATGLAETVGRIANEHGVRLRELHEEAPSLETAFLKLISSDADGGDA